ncbi:MULTISPECIES: imidazole glycerol phosphate synthase subunit HisH [Caldilinea]|uniref:Imidazole glycerol phosphate synthase subunit HisH n=1 Tax=Caldilinea aerophila (strain DSM 14535 / JCM 11387 / NBRC 104270 / STL-6-O1) TaxID=926550 RepID=I0I6T4_CALAS|nr:MULTISPECIES: imidazole glycerol phosphate synthase subunit HisH [Caldilinea]BAM00972.1 imidazole glycerol phosphate synthase subunit HisH [Caldilinea aerophila DSM 14535 = NBRC 104270]GIV72310.1 MAG: imidazole glycerol phosphate synthase subunit HisH [Caldilinea sp.]
MIAIIDYGVGNLRSVYKAFETVATPLGITVDIVERPTDFTRWRAIVLPGQGAFGDSVNNLRRQGFERPLLDAVESGVPLLGICVGMQLLFDSSEEMGQHEGLHLIPGAVRRFPDDMPDPIHPGRSLRVPQIGWNQLHIRRSDPLLDHVPDGAYAYFAHSYFCDAADPEAILATTDYGIHYPSIVRYRNAWGVQPHPEKSHTVGLRIVRNFIAMVAQQTTLPSSERALIGESAT